MACCGGAHAGFYGNYVSATYARPGANIALSTAGPVIAGPALEFPSIGATNISVDFTDTGFRIAFPATWNLLTGSPVFDGIYIDVQQGPGMPFNGTTGASIAASSIAGVGNNRLTPGATRIYVNLAGLGSIAAGNYIDVAVPFPPTAPYGCSVIANPTILPPGGGSVTLSATCLGNAATYYVWTVQPAGLSTQTTANSFTTTLTQSSTITVSAGNGAGVAQGVSISVPVQTATVPSGCTLTSSPASLPAGGGTVTLTAACAGGSAPTSFAWTGGFATGTTTTNSRSGTVSATTTFSVTASNAAGYATPASVTVPVAGAVAAPSGCSLSATPAILPAGGANVTLTAACSGGGAPTSFTWSGGFATGTTSVGTRSGVVTTPTTFGVVAGNAGGNAPVAVASVDVQSAGIAAPSGCTLVASPASLPAGGGNIALTVTCAGGGAPTAFAWSGGFASGMNTAINAVSGAVPATTAFSVVASNGGGSAPPAGATVTVAAGAASTTGMAVEYFNASMGHYFLTAFPEEAAALDAGKIAGWQRTGYSFPVEMNPVPGTQPVCRFFTVWFAPKSSHFYTPYPGECQTLKSNAVWQYEAIAFHLGLPDSSGHCAAGATPIYRFYNNGTTGAPNHRYTTDPIVVRVMKAQGWTQEGDAGTGIFACGAAPPASVTALNVQMEFQPSVRFLTTADGAALTAMTDTSLTFAKVVAIADGDVFVVPEIGAWHATSVQASAGRTTVGVEPATPEQLFSVLEISGNIDIDAIPESLPSAARSAPGPLVAKSLETETETTFVKTTNAAGDRGRKFTAKMQAQCGSDPQNKIRILELTGEIYGLPGITFSLRNPAAALAGPFPYKVTAGAYVGCKVSLPLGQLKLIDKPVPYTAGLVRLQVFARAKLETDIVPAIQFLELQAEGVYPATPNAPVVTSTNTSLASQLLAVTSIGTTLTATLTGELETSLKVIVPVANMYVLGAGVKAGPAVEAKATGVAKASGAGGDVNLCFQVKWPTELYTEFPSGTKMNHKVRFQTDYPALLPSAWQKCVTGNEPSGDWRFTPKVCAADPNNDPTCAFQCNPATDFTLSAAPDKSKIDQYFPVGSSNLYITLRPEGSVRNFTGTATDSTTVAVESMQFADDWKSAAWQYVAVYPSGNGVCSYQLGGDAVLIAPR